MLKITWGWRLLVFLTAGLGLVHCSGTLPVSSPTSQSTPSKMVETAYPSALVETAYPAAPLNPTAERAIRHPASPTQPVAIPVEWQTITDPQKLWSLQIPPDWSPGNLPDEYRGEDGFIRITYLPGMAYMQQARLVCERLANSPVGSGRKVGLVGSGELDLCAMPLAKDAQPAANWVILHHPEAEAASRFARIEISADQMRTILDTLVMLPVQQDLHQVPATKEPAEWLTSAILPPELYAEETAVEGKRPGQVQVRKGGETVYAFTALMGANNPVQEFTIWQDGWLMEVDGFLIQDGQILNDSGAYDELFGWRLLNGQPFYFFRRGQWYHVMVGVVEE